jgi:hypothetical protein
MHGVIHPISRDRNAVDHQVQIWIERRSAAERRKPLI